MFVLMLECFKIFKWVFILNKNWKEVVFLFIKVCFIKMSLKFGVVISYELLVNCILLKVFKFMMLLLMILIIIFIVFL